MKIQFRMHILNCSLPPLPHAHLKCRQVVGCAGSGVASFALTSEGDVWAWGGSKRGQLGLGACIFSSPLPRRVQGLKDVVQIACGWGHVLALTGGCGGVREWQERLLGMLHGDVGVGVGLWGCRWRGWFSVSIEMCVRMRACACARAYACLSVRGHVSACVCGLLPCCACTQAGVPVKQRISACLQASSMMCHEAMCAQMQMPGRFSAGVIPLMAAWACPLSL